MNKYIILIFGMVLISLISAGTYEADTELDFKFPFEVNGSVPSSTATCNISIQYPDGTHVRNNNQTSQINNGEFNITLTVAEINTSGEYDWVASCCDGTKCAMGYGKFEVTRTGKVTPESMPMLFGVMILVIFGVACFFLFLSLKVVETGPKIFLMLASLVFLMGSVGLGVVFADDNNVAEGISNLMGALLFAMGMIFIVIFFYIFIRQIIVTLNKFQIKKGLGMPISDKELRSAY